METVWWILISILSLVSGVVIGFIFSKGKDKPVGDFIIDGENVYASLNPAPNGDASPLAYICKQHSIRLTVKVIRWKQ